ncbi:hypothetical protein [Nitrosomonas aestuarii]|uniref:hypothetical protein n=1 Tax=Nitrosomonas aestuarii TaxID=52441 RepID=UPI0015E6C291|nr:hypothetical protein [Nitrosomonas aestuarii]
MEKNHDEKYHWFSLATGMAIQALLAERKGEKRLYVITEETPHEHHCIHGRWSRLARLKKIIKNC